MYDVYLSTKNLTPIIIIVENTKTGKYAGIMSGFIVRTFKFLPKSVSSILVINGGPIFDNSKTLEFLLINYCKKYNNTVVYSEIRNFNDYTNYNDIFLNNGFRYIKWSNIDLTIGEKEFFSKLINSKKRQIKKSIKNGLEIQTSVTLEELRSFYRILSSYYKNIIKKPLPSWEFFKNLYNFLYPKDLLKIFIVKKTENVWMT